MTNQTIEIFISHSSADFPALQSLRRQLIEFGIVDLADFERRESVEAVDTTVREAIGRASLVVMLLSKAFHDSPWLTVELRNAMSRWNGENLIVLALDDSPPPLGVRDMVQSFSPSDPNQVNDLAKRILFNAAKAALASPMIGTEPEPKPAAAHAPHSWRRPWLATALVLVLIAAGVGLLSIYGTLPDRSSSDHMIAGFKIGGAVWISLGIAVAVSIVWTLMFRRRCARKWLKEMFGHYIPPSTVETMARDSAQGEESAGEPDHPDVFVSYSWDDASLVEPLTEQMVRAGYRVWRDRTSEPQLGRFPARIVRAIKQARVVVVMGSARSFASDHVVREINVAGGRRKPFIWVQLDDADLPPEFEYFLAGFPRLPQVGAPPPAINDFGEAFRTVCPQ